MIPPNGRNGSITLALPRTPETRVRELAALSGKHSWFARDTLGKLSNARSGCAWGLLVRDRGPFAKQTQTVRRHPDSAPRPPG